VLQERAMLAQHARRTKLKTSDKGATLAEVVDGRLSQHGIDTEKISWDAFRREDGTWRITASWPSGKATAQAVWELDKARQLVSPHDDMAQYLCTDRGTPHVLGQEPPAAERPAPARGQSSRGDLGRGDHGRGDLGRDIGRDIGRDLDRDLRGDSRNDLGGSPSLGRDSVRHGHEPMRPGSPETSRRPGGRGLGNDPIRAGRDALLASLDRPLGNDRRSANELRTAAEPTEPTEPVKPAAPAGDADRDRPRARGAAALIGRSPFDDDSDQAKEIPAVPSLAVLRPRRNTASAAAGGDQSIGEKPRKRLPSWDDVLFGGAPARESS
jgi:hypothetical protein